MNYGHFDLANKEYVITNPATPAPWANYLGDPEYGAMISNNAAGYSFVKSGANGRVSRFRFNSDMALPGRYIYIRDNEANDYWIFYHIFKICGRIGIGCIGNHRRWRYSNWCRSSSLCDCDRWGHRSCNRFCWSQGQSRHRCLRWFFCRHRYRFGRLRCRRQLKNAFISGTRVIYTGNGNSKLLPQCITSGLNIHIFCVSVCR